MPKTARTPTEAALAAAAIRRKLRQENIPTSSISSKNYAGGNSITVRLVDAPPETVRKVELACKTHEMGDFDPTTDTYHVRPAADPDTPRVRFVHVENRMSPELQQRIAAFAQEALPDHDPFWDIHRLFEGRLPHFWEAQKKKQKADLQ